MRITSRKRRPGEIEFGLIYGGIAILGLAAAHMLPLTRGFPSCVVRGLTGLPCPTCGGTRAVIALSRGDLLSAFGLNPLVTAALAGAIALFIASLLSVVFNLPRLSVDLSMREKYVLRASAVIALCFQWLYLVFTL